MNDSTELYYAEMEAARNDAMHEYFEARPQLVSSLRDEAIFRAGFERAFKLLWDKHCTHETDEIRCKHAVLLTMPCSYCEGLSQEGGERIILFSPDGVWHREGSG